LPGSTFFLFPYLEGFWFCLFMQQWVVDNLLQP